MDALKMGRIFWFCRKACQVVAYLGAINVLSTS